MPKISEESKRLYSNKVQQYRPRIEAILKRERDVLKTLPTSDHVEQSRMALARLHVDLASCYLLLSRISIAILGMRNENYLNAARKSCYQSIIYLEQVVTDTIDGPYSEYSEVFAKIATISHKERFHLMRLLGFTIQAVEQGYGENSKWRWSFVELNGRFVVIAKNLMDIKQIVAELDPRFEGYKMHLQYLKLVKELLLESANRYREKYELTTLRSDDFRLAIRFLRALSRLHTILGEKEENEIIKRKIDVWKLKMETDERKAEE